MLGTRKGNRITLWDWHVALVAGKTGRSCAKEQWERVISVSRKEVREMVFRIASIILRLCGVAVALDQVGARGKN